MCGMIKPSFIPSPEILQLRDLMRYRIKLTNIKTGEKYQAFLPKKKTFESKIQADIIFIANELKTRPKKIHGFTTCKEIFERESAALNNSP